MIHNEQEVTDAEHPVGPSAGLPSYRGYEYQILATVWLGLELTTTAKAEAIVVEPPSEEDVALDLDVPSEHADSRIDAGKLQIQIKLRSNVLWKERDFAELLMAKPKTGKRGPAPRARPTEYLKTDPSCRYVLLTNVDTDSSLQTFLVSKLGYASTATRIPCTSLDDPGLATRLAILSGQKPELLMLKVRTILQDCCHVPGPQLAACIRMLKNRVRDRLLGIRANRFPSHEMQQVIRDHGGSFKPPCEPVHPSNFGRIKQQLVDKNALVLVGPPGTGKTTLANALMVELETSSPPAQRVTVSDAAGIEKVRRSLEDVYDHIYYFEDPWGQDVPGIGASFFTSELPKLLREARSGKRFVVTSRLGVFQQALGDRERLFQQYKQELRPKDYPTSAYRELYDRQIATWSDNYQKTARAWRTDALKLLETPYSVEVFCRSLHDRLETGDSVYGSDVEKLASNSNVDSFGAVLKDRIIAGGDEYIQSAVAIWAQLVVTPNAINGATVKTLRDLLRSGGAVNPPDVLRLFNDLADAQWFQVRSDGYVTTPSVRDAIAQFEVEFPAIFEDTIGKLFRGWSAKGTFEAIVSCVKASKGKIEICPNDITERLDAYLVSCALATDGYNFINAYNDLALFSRSLNPAATLVRALSQRDSSSSKSIRWLGSHEPKWIRPSLEQAEIASIRTSVETLQIAQKIVNHYIPHEVGMRTFGSAYEPEALLMFLGQFGWPLLKWFSSAFDDSVKNHDESTGFLAECLCVLDGSMVDKVFAACLASFQSFSSCHQEDKEEWRQQAQGEADTLPDGAGDGDSDRYYLAKSSLVTALKIKREHNGYTWIPIHANSDWLLDPWSELLKHDCTTDECEALVVCCDRHNRSVPALSVIERHPDSRFCRWVACQLISQREDLPGSLTDAVERYIASPDFLLALKQEAALLSSSQRVLTGLLIVSKKPWLLGFSDRDKPRPSAGAPENGSDPWQVLFARLFTEKEACLVSICYAASQRRDYSPDSHQLTSELTTLVDDWPDVPAAYALTALARTNTNIQSRLDRILTSADEKARASAWRLCDDRRRLLTQGLKDADWACRSAVMETLSHNATPAEQQTLFSLATDASAYVRETLIKCIGRCKWSEAVPVLIHLLRDHREYGEHHSNEDFRIFQVARSAADALNLLRPLHDDALVAIRTFLAECEVASLDTTVHGLLFRILAEQPSEQSFGFCAQYFEETWLKSKWRENSGHDLIVQCLHSIATMLQMNPLWGKRLSLPSVEQVAAWDDDDAWLVGPALIVLGLVENVHHGQAERLANLKSFSPARARILLSLSPHLQKNRPPIIMQHIPERHPFIVLLDIVTKSPLKLTYDELRTSAPAVEAWIDSLGTGSKLATYERWAIRTLIKDGGVSASVNDLHHPFSFPEKV